MSDKYNEIELTRIFKDITLSLDANFKRVEALEKKLDVWIEGQKKYNRATGETIAELKESLNEVAQNRIGWEENIEEVLQDYMELVDITITENVDGQSLEYYRKRKEELLEKLDSPTLPDPYYPCGKEKTEKKEHKHIWVIDKTVIGGIRCSICNNPRYKLLSDDGVDQHYTEIKYSGGDDKCEECGGYRMGENMMHNDWCSQCTTTTTAEKAEPEKDYVRFVRNYEGYWKSEYDKAIEEFMHKWIGLKYLCIDDNGAWEYWSKIYKEYEGRLKE